METRRMKTLVATLGIILLGSSMALAQKKAILSGERFTTGAMKFLKDGRADFPVVPNWLQANPGFRGRRNGIEPAITGVRVVEGKGGSIKLGVAVGLVDVFDRNQPTQRPEYSQFKPQESTVTVTGDSLRRLFQTIQSEPKRPKRGGTR